MGPREDRVTSTPLPARTGLLLPHEGGFTPIPRGRNYSYPVRILAALHNIVISRQQIQLLNLVLSQIRGSAMLAVKKTFKKVSWIHPCCFSITKSRTKLFLINC